ncbi:hypothetical protein BCR39DRAFT_308649 [Naematelia encephala]|uniref:Uncharacterized protein n=1 Tax=Naematelia encephala TaxID=71784 RepID=A0A1Y2ARX9_9TREE|nr:hypothetical protein BCR39DRAFT_308649 [Naematelia encephala]
MFFISSFTLAALLTCLRLVTGQVTTSTTIYPLFPNGEQDSDGSLESTIPIPCEQGCPPVIGSYFYCYVNTTLPNGNLSDAETCNTHLCNSTIYDQLSACLNCIVANGDERPFGYYSNTSLTAGPTAPSNPLAPFNPNGLINADQANKILSNVTARCASVSSSITGASTITASPTTTGPYYTEWTANQTITLAVWTGLSQYPAPIVTEIVTLTTSNSSPTAASSSSAATSASSTGTTSSAEFGKDSALSLFGACLLFAVLPVL